MKWDWDIIKSLLEEIDALEDPQMQGIVIEAKEKRDPAAVVRVRHAIMLLNGEFLTGSRIDNFGGAAINAPDLTVRGHDLLEALRRVDVWDHLQALLAAGRNPSFDQVLGFARAELPAPSAAPEAPQAMAASAAAAIKPADLTDWRLLLHPMVIEHALHHFDNGHLREAVLNAIMVPYEIMKQRTGIDLDGYALAGQVLGVKAPRLILSDLVTESGRNDQAGFLQILQGAATAIRNVKAHSLGHDLHPTKAAEYLVFASLLARRISEAQDASPPLAPS
jgi:uncharacterized protein (TIGR02391 family)